jgi:hypothetical protein
MKPFDQDRLLSNLLAGDELSAFRRSSLEQGLALLRRRRRYRRVARWCLLASLPLAFAAGVFLAWPPPPEVRPVSVAESPAAGLSAAAPKARPLKFITDEQLLALFPGRPIALIGQPGHQQLLFLDQPAANPEPAWPSPAGSSPSQW